MEKEEYLPGSARDRFKDLRDRENLTQEQLAKIADVQVSTISKIESGATTKIASTILEKIADHFHITTDFLLGRVDIPDKSAYQIEQLGLSMEAAKNLYTGKANPAVITALLENKKFAALSYNIDSLFEEHMIKAIVSQNQILSNVSMLLRNNGIEDGANDVASLKESQPNSLEIDKLSREFGACLRDIKKSMESQLDETRKLVSETFITMVESVTADSSKPLNTVTPNDILGVMKNMISANADYMSEDEIDAFINSAKPLFAPIPKKELIDND